MSFELGRALLLTEAITPEGLGQALLTAARDEVSLVRAILITGAMDPGRLEQELSRAETPSMRAVLPVREITDRLPHGLCARMCAIPVRRDPRTGTIDVAVPDLRDAHGAHEIGYLLGAPIRVVRAPLVAIERAVGEHLDGPVSRRFQTPARGVGPAVTMRPVLQISDTPVPPTPQDIPIPLTRRSVRPQAPPSLGYPALVLAEHEIHPTYATADNLTSAVENAVERVIHVREQSTLIPPPAESVPPPPNTEPRPPTFASAPPPPPVPRRSQPPPGFGDAGTILSAIRAAKDRDTVLELLLIGTRAVALRVALFVVRRDEFVGWMCTSELGDEGELQQISIPTESPSILAIGATNGSYLGRIPLSESHVGLLRVMGSASRDVAVAPVRVFGRPTVLILADELGESMIATRRMEELAMVAGDALARIVRERAERG